MILTNFAKNLIKEDKAKGMLNTEIMKKYEISYNTLRAVLDGKEEE